LPHTISTRRRGRPPKAVQDATRVPLSFRVTPAVRARLEKAALKNGRSLSHEAEFRLEQSFAAENIGQAVDEYRQEIAKDRDEFRVSLETAIRRWEKIFAAIKK
jgi:TraY domain